MPAVSKQVRKFACVIEALPLQGEAGLSLTDYDRITESLEELCKAMACHYWAILHDRDVDEDTGECKRPHIHVVLETQTRHTCLGVVRAIAEAFGVSSVRVSVRECRHLKLSIRYLLHLDDPEKAIYNPFDIIHNEQELLSLSMVDPSDDMTIETLERAIRSTTNVKELVYRIGLKNYQRYRSTINDIVGIIRHEQRQEISERLEKEGEAIAQRNRKKQ